jgi:hypothetical protein
MSSGTDHARVCGCGSAVRRLRRLLRWVSAIGRIGAMSEDPAPRLPDRSVLRGVTPYEWDMQEAVRFEVAHDVINDEVGAINGLLYRLGRRTDPEAQTLRAEAKVARVELVSRKDALRGADAAGISAALAGARERIAHWNGLAVS